MENGSYYDRRGTVTLGSLTFEQAVRMLSHPLHVVVPESEISRPQPVRRSAESARPHSSLQTSNADCTTRARPVM